MTRTFTVTLIDRSPLASSKGDLNRKVPLALHLFTDVHSKTASFRVAVCVSRSFMRMCRPRTSLL